MSITRVPVKSRNNPMGFVEYIPKNTPKGIVNWCHGTGSEKGGGSYNELAKIEGITIMKYLQTNYEDFIILAPQDYNGMWGLRHEDFIEWALVEYGFSKLTNQAGLSGGGYACRNTMDNNSKTAKKILSYTPMSTNLVYAFDNVKNIVENDQYVWIHHGEKDTSPNALSSVSGFNDAMRKLDPKRCRLTVYKGMGHSAWNEVYDGSGIHKEQLTGPEYFNWTSGTWYEWLASLSHSNPIPEPEPVKDKVIEMYKLNNELHVVYESGIDEVLR